MAEKENTLDWTGTDKSDHLLTPEVELMSEGPPQGSRLPTSVQHDFMDATPSGEGQVSMDVEGARFLQGVSHGPQWTNAMPFGGMRVNPWKVCTGTEDPRECNGHVRESSRTVSGYEDVLGYRDNQGFCQGSNVTNNRYENNLRTNPLNNFAHNSNSAYGRGNKKAATYDGLGCWQDYIVHLAEINGWDENTKALELATCLRESAQAILSDFRPDLRRSCAHLVAAFTSRFQPNNKAELYRAQMKGKSRNKDQSLPELAQDIQRVTRLAYPTAPKE
ncbi:unnamed protein product [Mytilus coruscus]|uniref:Uncharacterized protein n=1 Tax=Mytilus coruscus TaxID=42192 RepID=A0A6J8B3J8_MYTCO|nr:unnamed protein product [Mytilus coruscus]